VQLLRLLMMARRRITRLVRQHRLDGISSLPVSSQRMIRVLALRACIDW
jgi:hypothetical protein